VPTVEFHTGLDEPVGFACRLLRRAYRSGARVLVTAPAPTLASIDRVLWTLDERDFVPHVRWSAALPSSTARRTPIWLAEFVPEAPPPVLVNVGAPAPEDLTPFERVIEVVGAAPDEAQAGRERWRGYKARGISPRHVGDPSAGA
jgi:DNA polymerase-3 subunit chi